MRYLAIIGYWCVAIVVIATIFVSFDYTFSHTLFMGSLYLPALLCLRIMMPQVDFSNKKEGVRNAIFIALVLTAISLPQIYLERWLSEREKRHPQTIDFISDRHRVSLEVSDIAFVESNDSEVWIHTTHDKHRTKTTISQWESILDNGDFVRIHRAYIVNRRHITSLNSSSVMVADNELPISRKYRDIAKEKCSTEQNR